MYGFDDDMCNGVMGEVCGVMASVRWAVHVRWREMFEAESEREGREKQTADGINNEGND